MSRMVKTREVTCQSPKTAASEQVSSILCGIDSYGLDRSGGKPVRLREGVALLRHAFNPFL